VAARLARQLIGREGHADRRFAPINNNGWLISEAGAQYKPSFDLNKAIALKTGEHGLDFLLTMIKLRGFDGKTDFWQYGL
jgi:pyrimidine oxygenase